MKKPSEVLVRDQEIADLKLRVVKLERASAAMSARMLALFGPAEIRADVVAVGEPRPAVSPAAR